MTYNVVLLLSRAWLFCDPIDSSLPIFSVHGIPQQEHWSRLPFPSPGDLSDPGIEPASPAFSVSEGGLSTSVSPGKPYKDQDSKVRPSVGTERL